MAPTAGALGDAVLVLTVGKTALPTLRTLLVIKGCFCLFVTNFVNACAFFRLA